MHAQNSRAFGHGKRSKRQTAVQPLAYRAVQGQHYHALARNTDQQRPTKGVQGFHMFKEAQIVLKRLGKAKPGIKDDLIGSDSRLGALSDPFSKKSTHFT